MKLAYNARELLTEEGEIEPQDEGASPEAHMQRIDVRRLVDEVLDDLPPRLRLVLVMSDADEMPMSEIAEVLEIPMGTGYSRLHAARREFARAWSKHCEEQAPHAAAYGLAPSLLFDAGELCDREREIPEQPGGFEDQVWNSRAAIAKNARVRDMEIATALAALADHERRFPGALFAQQREALRGADQGVPGRASGSGWRSSVIGWTGP